MGSSAEPPEIFRGEIEIMTTGTTIKALLLAAVMTVGALAQTADNAKANGSTAGDSSQLSGANNATYIIGAEDTLHIAVWKETDLTVTLPVRPDGQISMPLLNDVQAAGLTPMQLAASLTEKLKKYVTDPRVTVVVTAMNSQRIYVLGEVLHSGAMPLTPNMTVLQALATAGFTQFANTKGIYVLRAESGKQQKIPVNYKQLIKGNAPNISLKPADTIVVP
jgi:polysaccharide biosynthesis/export protein